MKNQIISNTAFLHKMLVYSTYVWFSLVDNEYWSVSNIGQKIPREYFPPILDKGRLITIELYARQEELWEKMKTQDYWIWLDIS